MGPSRLPGGLRQVRQRLAGQATPLWICRCSWPRTGSLFRTPPRPRSKSPGARSGAAVGAAVARRVPPLGPACGRGGSATHTLAPGESSSREPEPHALSRGSLGQAGQWRGSGEGGKDLGRQRIATDTWGTSHTGLGLTLPPLSGTLHHVPHFPSLVSHQPEQKKADPTGAVKD